MKVENFFLFIGTLIAAFVAFIGYQNYQIIREKFKLDLFNKRYAVFKSVQIFLSHILREGRVGLDNIFQFRGDTQDALFLFEDDISNYLKEIDNKALQLWQKYEEIKDKPVGEERSKLAREISDLLTFLSDQIPKLKDVFSPYLRFKSWR